MYIDLLQVYQQQLSTLEREIDALAAQLEEYELLQSIPGIGERIAALKKLVAFALVKFENKCGGECSKINNFFE